jgi:hypothetical protein
MLEVDAKTAAEQAKRRAEQAKTESGAAFIRPRMLTAASTKVLRAIGEKLRDAPPLKKIEKVAEAE